MLFSINHHHAGEPKVQYYLFFFLEILSVIVYFSNVIGVVWYNRPSFPRGPKEDGPGGGPLPESVPT